MDANSHLRLVVAFERGLRRSCEFTASNALWKLDNVPSPMSPITRQLKRATSERTSSRCFASARMASARHAP